MKQARPSLNRIFIGIDSTEVRNRLICQANKEYGYSASAIARELNVHRSTIGRILGQCPDEFQTAKPRVIDSPVIVNIVEQALELLKKDGRENLSLRKLASVMEMSATNLYNYFKNKNDLLDGIRVYGLRQLLKQVKQNGTAEKSPEKKLKHVVDAYFDFGIKHADLYEIMFNRREIRVKEQPSPTLQEVISLVDELNYYVREVLRDFMSQKKELSSIHLREMVFKLWSQLHGLISLHIGGSLIYMSKLTQKDFWAVRDHLIENLK